MKTHLDLFSGIGGFALAAKWAGFETVAFCEIEEYPRKVLEKNFPGVAIHRDVREIDGNDYRNTTLITGGYPCQPFSLAGQRGGEEDDRHLWPEMFRIIKQARPTWVVAENVAGHITMGLDQVLSELESEGYAARPVVIPACAVDAPHRRDRVWIIAKAISTGKRPHAGAQPRAEDECEELQRKDREALPDDDLSVCEVVAYTNSKSKRRQEVKTDSSRVRGEARMGAEVSRRRLNEPSIGKALANSPHSNDRGSNSGEVKRQAREFGNGGSEGDVSNSASIHAQGQHNGPGQGELGRSCRWPAEPRVGRVANGIPSRVDRLKGLGNAIVPQVAYQILRLL